MSGFSRGVAIVMATYNPDLSIIKEQLESIRNQSVKDWTCYISDDSSDNEWYDKLDFYFDSRFKLKVWDQNVGTFRNFERGLRTINKEEVIFLCDQDDVWRIDKIEKTLSAFSRNIVLVHSNAQLIDQSGNEISGTLHEIEKTDTQEFTDTGLILKNTITGSTTAFKSEVLKSALPFPEVGGIQHDVWIALAATRHGSSHYLPESLIKYRQHNSNAVGIRKPNVFQEFLNPRSAAIAYLIKNQLAAAYESRFFHNPLGELHIFKLGMLNTKKRLYAYNYIFGKVVVGINDFPTNLKIGLITKLNIANQILRRTSIKRLRIHDYLRKIKRLFKLAKRLIVVPEIRRKLIASLRDIELDFNITKKTKSSESMFTLPQTQIIDYQLCNREEGRLIIFLPSLKIENIFGGLSTAIRLGVELEENIEVQICVTDNYEDALSDESIHEIATGLLLNEELLRSMLGRVEYKLVTFSEKDTFLTTAWWTTEKATQIRKNSRMNEVKIYYLVQDFEPLFYPSSDLSAAALKTYRDVDKLIVNSSNLSHYILDNLKLNSHNFLTFEPQYLKQDLEIREIRDRKAGPIRIVIYGRPSVPRNAFLTLISSLNEALVRFPLLSCEILSVGEKHSDIDLDSGHVIRSLGKLPLADYQKLLACSDLGVSLMLSPHPSYPPLEMASAGMQVITNDYFGYKEILGKRYKNLHIVEATSDSISNKICQLILNNVKKPEYQIEQEIPELTLEQVAKDLISEIRDAV